MERGYLKKNNISKDYIKEKLYYIKKKLYENEII